MNVCLSPIMANSNWLYNDFFCSFIIVISSLPCCHYHYVVLSWLFFYHCHVVIVILKFSFYHCYFIIELSLSFCQFVIIFSCHFVCFFVIVILFLRFFGIISFGHCHSFLLTFLLSLSLFHYFFFNHFFKKKCYSYGAKDTAGVHMMWLLHRHLLFIDNDVIQ